MVTSNSTALELVSTIRREAQAAAVAACRFLDLIGFPKEPVPLGFALSLAARVRFVQWEAMGWGHLVPSGRQPTDAGLARFMQGALVGHPVEPAWSNTPSAFREYFTALVYRTAWSGGTELRAPVAINRVRRLSPVEMATLASFLWKYRHIGRN
jgi:hypothetical protein